ncbi:MAG TPA: response regulator transcription factor [Candidatus Acidoferrales bacterium]|nr:response regulator transcription factor [Candidatus Acidoferrales bacterium]
MSHERILVVEDEPEIAEVVKAYLTREGFQVEVQGDGPSAVSAANRELPSLMIVDVGLPEMSGFEVYRKVAEQAKIPTIFLTARSDEVDRIVGLELGADDYVVKPFSPRELVARVRAVLRRLAAGPSTGSGHVLRIHDLAIDLDAHDVRRADTHVELTPAEFRILAALAAEPGRVFTRAQLLDKLDDDGGIYERTLDRHINNLRKKLEPHPEQPIYVLTVYGVGYKMRK